jgi:hypothetical protein
MSSGKGLEALLSWHGEGLEAFEGARGVVERSV